MAKRIPYEENHRTISGVLQKKCNKHDIYFPEEDPWMPCTLEYYHANKSSKRDGLNTWCKRCAVKKSTENIKQNPLRHKKAMKEYRVRTESYLQSEKERMEKYKNEGRFEDWRKSNPDKISGYNKKHQNKKHQITTQEWEDNKSYFDNKCAYCGLPIEQHYRKYAGKLVKSDFHKEHVIDDGKNDLRNCVPSCGSCNSSKINKTLNEWYNPSNPNYSRERYLKIYHWIRYDYKKYIKPKKIFYRIKGDTDV